MVARRSKAGFEKVHVELLRRYISSVDTGDKLATRRASFWRSKKKPHGRNFSASTMLPETGTFRSYLTESGGEKSTGDTNEIKGEINIVDKSNTNKVDNVSENKLSAFTGNKITVSTDVETSKATTGKENASMKPCISDKKELENIPYPRESKTDNQAQIYDIPPSTSRKMSDTDQDYIQMDGGGLDIDLDDDESDDYTNVKELLQLRKTEKPRKMHVYVNCTKQMQRKQSRENEKTLDIYSSTQLIPEDVTYAAVNKTNKKKIIDKIEIESQNEDQYDYDYINCDEVDLLSQLKDTQPPKPANKRQTATPNISRKPDLIRQTSVSSEDKDHNNKNDETTEDTYMCMSGTGSELEFYSFSVEEVVAVLESCALPHMANICRKESLDGAFFKDISKADLCEEPFRMNWFYINKFSRVINGWRPKRMTLNIQ